MKLPWVSRAVYELLTDVVSDMRQALVLERDRVARAEARYESLVTRMLDLKREGFVQRPPPPEPLKPSESALSPQVEFEIEKASSGDPFLRRRLNVWAQTQAAMKRDDAAIVHGIRYGDEPDEMENTD